MSEQAVRLQISPSTLPFTRELLQAADVTINLTPRSTGRPIVHQQGHIYILSDLFLVCERMSLAERASRGPEGSDMWLLYPPLAGKHLKVFEVEGQGAPRLNWENPIYAHICNSECSASHHHAQGEPDTTRRVAPSAR